MKKSRLSLYIGLPILGLSWLIIGVAPDPAYPASSLILILAYIDVIPYLISRGLADMIRSPEIFVIFLTVMVHVAFWLPVAYGIYKLWRYLEKSKRNPRRDALGFKR